jgi:imidazolonepropionase-like amidohydrolase
MIDEDMNSPRRHGGTETAALEAALAVSFQSNGNGSTTRRTGPARTPQCRRASVVKLALLLSLSAASTDVLAGDEARPAAGESVLAIVGGDVYTGTGSVIRGGVVICRGRKIEAVGADLKVPEGARVVDAKGRRVLPGLIAPLGTGMGVARGRPKSGERYEDSLDPVNMNAELALSAGITAFHHEGERKGIFGATNAVIKPAHGEPELMVVKEPAALTVAWSSAVQERLGFEQTLEKARKWRMDGSKGAAPAPQAVLDALARKIPVRISAPTKADVAAALRFAKRWDVKLVLLDCHEAWTLAEDVAAAGATCVIEPRTRRWPGAGEEFTAGSNIEACALLEKAGAKFCVLPPGGFGQVGWGVTVGQLSGRDLHTYSWEAAFAVRGGASAEASLRAITLTAAEALGVDDRLGSLAPGKDADVVVWQGDPLDYRMNVETTIVSGRVLYERSKSKLFAHLPDRR